MKSFKSSYFRNNVRLLNALILIVFNLKVLKFISKYEKSLLKIVPKMFKPSSRDFVKNQFDSKKDFWLKVFL